VSPLRSDPGQGLLQTYGPQLFDKAFLDEPFRFRMVCQLIWLGTLLLEEIACFQFGQGEALVVPGLNLLGLSPESALNTDEGQYDNGFFNHSYFFEGQGISIETFRL
jgi:hypothetical protein